VKPREVEMTDAIKNAILHQMNTIRNDIAGGKYPGKKYPTASAMRTFEWNTQLQYMASLNVKTCESKHDCHSM
jgi:hypothetical protein